MRPRRPCLPDADLSERSRDADSRDFNRNLGSKDGRVWAINTSSMGHLQGTGTAPQVFAAASLTPSFSTGTYGGLYFEGTGYFPITGSPMVSFSFSGSTYNTTPVATSPGSYFMMSLTGSSNGGGNAILWAVTSDTGIPVQTARQATLRALSPATLAELWSSGSGDIGTYSKYILTVGRQRTRLRRQLGR